MILDAILADTRVLVAQRRAETPEAALRERIATHPPSRDLLAALRRPGVSVIAEIKRASPSKGALNLGLEPGPLAARYVAAGASALSVLTEPTRFKGSLEDLTVARQGLATAGLDAPLLRKDFVVDAYQLYEARAWGADAVLLIVAAMDDAALASLYETTLDLGLTPLIEVHTAAELFRALALDPPLIGINNRNLSDFTVSLETTRSLRPLIPPGVTVVSESGIHTPEDMAILATLGVDAALIGEALVTAGDVAATLRGLIAGGCGGVPPCAV